MLSKNLNISYHRKIIIGEEHAREVCKMGIVREVVEDALKNFVGLCPLETERGELSAGREETGIEIRRISWEDTRTLKEVVEE